jgi:murein L,D-transpeptidase YafK
LKKILIMLAICGTAIAGVYLLSNRENHAPLPQVIKSRHSALPRNPAPLHQLTGVDSVLIEKGLRHLSLYRKGEPLKTYRIALGNVPVGKKTTKGDRKTPEGSYIIDRRKSISRYYRALHISYPNAEDRRQAKARGVSTVGDVMIHGLPNGRGTIGSLHLKRDWTLGCIAMTNEEIDEIWQAVPDGTPVMIVP